MNKWSIQFAEKMAFFVKHVERHFMQASFIENRVLNSKNTMIINDLNCQIDFYDYTTIITYNISKDISSIPWEKQIELDHTWFFEIYTVLFAYIRNFNKRN